MNNATQQLEAIQLMVLVPDSAALQDNVRSFWDIQDKVLDAMENFTNGWFERRHVGTHTALEAAQRMCKAQTPVDLVREYQEWVGGAFQRVMADGVACQQFVGAFKWASRSAQCGSRRLQPIRRVRRASYLASE